VQEGEIVKVYSKLEHRRRVPYHIRVKHCLSLAATDLDIYHTVILLKKPVCDFLKLIFVVGIPIRFGNIADSSVYLLSNRLIFIRNENQTIPGGDGRLYDLRIMRFRPGQRTCSIRCAADRAAGRVAEDGI